MISPLPGATADQARLLHAPVLRRRADVVKRDGTPCAPNEGGFLVIRSRGRRCCAAIYGDPERYVKSYWSARSPGAYFTGDGARRDEDGYFWVMGRIDDVLNVAGHRLGTMEIESALVSHPEVAEAAVVGPPARAQGAGDRRVRDAEGGQTPHAPRSRRRCATTSCRRSARSRGPTRSASPTRCPRRARARSCAACSRRSPPTGIDQGRHDDARGHGRPVAFGGREGTRSDQRADVAGEFVFELVSEFEFEFVFVGGSRQACPYPGVQAGT